MDRSNFPTRSGWFKESFSLSEAEVVRFFGRGRRDWGASFSETSHFSSEAGGKCSSLILAFLRRFNATEKEEESMSEEMGEEVEELDASI